MIRSLITALFTTLALLAGQAASAADVNQASAAELEAVKGIGPALSGKILAARQQGSFKSWSDLVDRVAGMGPGNAARLSQNGLTVAGSGYTPVAAADKAADKAARPARAAAERKPAKDAAPAKTQG
ncbi:MAG: helix-hairpin-helix domain-containing protein [Burkholderiaceae bacterium]|jgi:competence protein ComEA|nr:helix-hairpin-helix domain-containing protein [Burkholderiaceae bacterium]